MPAGPIPTIELFLGARTRIENLADAEHWRGKGWRTAEDLAAAAAAAKSEATAKGKAKPEPGSSETPPKP